METWIVALLVVLLYIQLFNVVANMYFDSGRTLTIHDLWRKIVPPIKIEI
jgi:hypothetical protein